MTPLDLREIDHALTVSEDTSMVDLLEYGGALLTALRAARGAVTDLQAHLRVTLAALRTVMGPTADAPEDNVIDHAIDADYRARAVLESCTDLPAGR